jgi:tRNA(fMet)-specific endonuclease VapC
MKLALDTNRYTDLANGVQEVVNTLQAAEMIVMPLITIAELRGGFLMGKKGQANEQFLAAFLARPDVMSAYPDEETTRHYAMVYQQLRRQGTPIPSNDMWIAALALQHGFMLYARDAHFDHLPQVQRI